MKQTLLLKWILYPLHQILGENHLIVTQVAAPVITPIHLAMTAALLATWPIIFFHFWSFVKPSLYQKEKKLLKWILLSSFLLFISGALFCFFIILPFLFQLFSTITPQYIQYLPDLSSAASFILHLSATFGVCFQLPLLCVVLVKSGVTTLTTLKKLRPYVIVSSFIIGMLLTPPDVLSQIMLAVPLCLLYEAGVLFLYFESP